MAFLGMRGTGAWGTDVRPKNFREMILRLYPNGMAPLTALMSKLASEAVDDPEYNWWTKTIPSKTGTITGNFTDALSTAYVSGGDVGDAHYIQMAEADADKLRAGHIVLLRDASNLDVDVVAKVTSVVKNGANSYAVTTLREADDNSGSNDLSDADTFLIIGNSNAEGAARPEAISYDPVKFNNYTQIFRTSLEITRTQKKTRLRTGDAYKELKRDALEDHSIEMERGFLWGIPTEVTGSNGQPERTTGGVIHFVKQYAPANIDDFIDESATWASAGEEWLDNWLELLFRYGSREKLCFIGSGGLLGIQKIVKSGGQFSFTPKTMSYGIQVVEWVTPFGTLYLKTHPLFSFEAATRNMAVVIDSKNLKYRYIDDTMFKPDPLMVKGGATGVDGQQEEFLTEAGLELHHPETFGIGYNIGVDGA
jgi:hypothetical protein